MRISPCALGVLLGACLATAARADAPPRFPAGAVWHQDISQAAPHPQSASMIAALNGLGGFGFGRMQIDFAMQIVRAPAGAPTRNTVAWPDSSEYYLPDCENPGSAIPVPANAAIEGVDALACDNDAEDCHLLVVQGNTLFENYKSNASGASGLQSQCLVVWKTDRIYPDSGRGDHCSSADAAGFPIAPLLFNADEVHAAMQVANGDLGHAIRFILPNPRMASTTIGGKRYGYYVRPASHAGAPSGGEATVPYGSRLRLRSDFPVSSYPAAAQVVLRTMQRYGIVLADGGNIALTAEGDRYTTHKWSEVGLTARVFDQAVPASPVRVTDFTVLDTGPRIVETYDCVRNAEPPPLTTDPAPTALSARVVRAAPKLPSSIEIRWIGGAAQLDIYRNNQLWRTVVNGNVYYEKYAGGARPTYRLCTAGSSVCTGSVMAQPERSTGPVPATTPPIKSLPASASAPRTGGKSAPVKLLRERGSSD
jgi:hypothetical protein